jgi:hypothetical protein
VSCATKEKSAPAEVNRDAQRKANVTHSFSVKALPFLEIELDENITALIALALLLLFS